MICRSEIKSWAVGLRERYAPATVTSIVTVLSALLADAARDGLIPLNPCRHLRLGPRSTRPQPIATPAQIARIAARLSPTEALLVITAAYTGMRWGELAGLHRRNAVLEPLKYSLAAGVPHVRVDAQEGALHEVGGRLSIGTPKTDSSARIVALPPFLAQMLTEHLESHPHPYVFAGRDGGLLRRGGFRVRHWLPALAGDPDHQDPDLREPACRHDLPPAAAYPQDLDDRGRHTRDRPVRAPGPPHAGHRSTLRPCDPGDVRPIADVASEPVGVDRRHVVARLRADERDGETEP